MEFHWHSTLHTTLWLRSARTETYQLPLTTIQNSVEQRFSWQSPPKHLFYLIFFPSHMAKTSPVQGVWLCVFYTCSWAHAKSIWISEFVGIFVSKYMLRRTVVCRDVTHMWAILSRQAMKIFGAVLPFLFWPNMCLRFFGFYGLCVNKATFMTTKLRFFWLFGWNEKSNATGCQCGNGRGKWIKKWEISF